MTSRVLSSYRARAILELSFHFVMTPKTSMSFAPVGNWLQLIMAEFAALLALAILKLVGYT
jgi:hypothetical protein